MKLRFSVICVLLVLLVPIFVAAAELNFSAEADRTTVGLGEQLQLTVTVEGTNIGGAPQPQVPALSDFDQLGSTSSQSTNISFINGRMTQQNSISFIYFLSPKRVGSLTIPAFKLSFKGTTYETQPITITVTKESQAPPPPSRQQQQQSPFGFPGNPEPSSSGRGNVHLTASADRTSVYQGEQVTVTFVLYTQAQIGDLGIKDMPGFTGTWTEPIYDAKELNWRSATYSGERYNAATLKQVALFPTQSGDVKVDKMTVSGQMVVGGFIFQSAEPFEVSSDPTTINVKPLPEVGKPQDFSGGVGDFKVAAALSRDSSVGGEPITLIVRISGTGNIGLVGEPQLEPISGVKVLSPETKQTTQTTDGRIAGERTFNYPLIPTSDGRFVIPEITTGFFNPKTGSYYTQTTPRLEFVATGAAGKAPLPEAETGVKTLGTDILHIKPAFSRQSAFTGRGSLVDFLGWFFYPAGLVVLGVGVVLGRHRRRLEQDRGYARRTRSSRLVKKGLAEATRLLVQGNEREFYAALNRAVVHYVGDRFNLETSGMTGDQIQAELTSRNVEADTVSNLLELIASCDAARFSSGMARCTPQETLEKARTVLEKL